MKRAFISFDFDNDSDLKWALVGQSRLEDSPFSVADWSVKEPFPSNWVRRVEDKIALVDVVPVICGAHTHLANGVSIEVEIANRLGRPWFLLAGRANQIVSRPQIVSSTVPIYRWTWENLKILIGGGR